PSGKRVDSPVRIVDILPTILEVLELPVPEGIQGRSLLPVVSGDGRADVPVYAECYVPELNFRWAPLVAIREDGFKYIDAPRPELYDLESDPGETKNLYDSERDRANRMRALLQERIEGFPDSLSSRLQPDPETIARLRSLGYAAAGSDARAGGTGDLPDPKDRIHLWRRLEEVILDRGAGDLERAIQGSLEVLEEDPTNLLALELLAGARTDSGDRDGAIEIYRRILSLDDSRPLSHVLFGNLLWQSGDFDGAEKSFEKALEKDSGFARARRRLGELYLTRGEHERALESFRKAADVAGEEDVEVGLGLARALKASGDPTGAMKELTALHQRRPEDPEVLAEYAGTLAQGGDFDGALALLARGPDHHDVHFTASVILRSRDRMEEALVELERALAL
ncbi:MAG: tetratricopeptide repeat protein, partial [Vicinamibacteria bacterium]